MSKPYTAAVIGLGGVSRDHLAAIGESSAFELVAVCDTDPERVRSAERPGTVKTFADAAAMMAAVAPDLVVVATPSCSHAWLTMEVAEWGPRAILCEKPMSVHYRDAVTMAATCAKWEVELLVNHQRRLVGAAFGRAQVAAGLIGELLQVEARCGGDFLSDGTHAVDAARCLGGDRPAGSVFGAVDMGRERTQRYGHDVEQSAFVSWQDDRDTRYLVYTGELARRRQYQDWLLTGTEGVLWHPGGVLQPYWWIHDGKAGDHRIGFDEHHWFPVPVPCTQGGSWRLLGPGKAAPELGLSLRLLGERLGGATEPHPLRAEGALRVHEIVNAGYLSALARRCIELPLPAETEFPMDLLAAEAY